MGTGNVTDDFNRDAVAQIPARGRLIDAERQTTDVALQARLMAVWQRKGACFIRIRAASSQTRIGLHSCVPTILSIRWAATATITTTQLPRASSTCSSAWGSGTEPAPAAMRGLWAGSTGPERRRRFCPSTIRRPRLSAPNATGCPQSPIVTPGRMRSAMGRTWPKGWLPVSKHTDEVRPAKAI